MSHSSTLLVVDDQPDIRNFLRKALAQAGYQVVSAASAAEALIRLQQPGVDLILLDFWMPEANGGDFLRTYAQQPGPHMPVLLMTASSTAETAEMAMLSAGILYKPFTVRELYRSVHQILESGEMHQ